MWGVFLDICKSFYFLWIPSDAFLGMRDLSEMGGLSLQRPAEPGIFPPGLFPDANTHFPQHHWGLDQVKLYQDELAQAKRQYNLQFGKEFVKHHLLYFSVGCIAAERVVLLSPGWDRSCQSAPRQHCVGPHRIIQGKQASQPHRSQGIICAIVRPGRENWRIRW